MAARSTLCDSPPVQLPTMFYYEDQDRPTYQLCNRGFLYCLAYTFNVEHQCDYCYCFFIACSMQKRREKAWGISSCDLQHNCQMSSSHLLSAAKWCTRLILHSVLATKMGQAPAESYTKCMKHTQAKSYDSEGLQSNRCEIPKSDAIISWSKKMALFGVAPLISQPSLSG